MAGATNRAMKAAGVPKATIATLRVEHGGHLSLRSAISIAHERGLDTGKAHEFMTKRDAKKAAAPAAQAATADFRSKAAATMKAAGERKAAMMAERQKRIAGTVRDLGRGMLAARKAGAKPSFDGAMGKFKAHAQKQIDDYYAANFPNSKTKPTLHYSDGEKYIRVTKVEPGQKTGSAHSFIDKATGDVLKPDGFKRPAKGARGNIFSGDFGVNEHGANYSAAYMKRRGATDFYAAPSKGPSKRERQANADARDVIMGPRAGAAKPAMTGARPFNADRHKARAMALSEARKAQLAAAEAKYSVVRNRYPSSADVPQAALQRHTANLSAALRATVKARDAVDRAAALNRAAGAKVSERDAVRRGETGTRDVQMRQARSDLAGLRAPGGNRAHIMTAEGPKAVDAVASSKNFFVHKEPGYGGRFVVSHRDTGMGVASNNTLSGAKRIMDGMKKTGHLTMKRLEQGGAAGERSARAMAKYLSAPKRRNVSLAERGLRAGSAPTKRGKEANKAAGI